MKKIKLVIDCRENAIINESDMKINYEIKQLPICDFMFIEGGNENESGSGNEFQRNESESGNGNKNENESGNEFQRNEKPKICIERKTPADLASSIVDGRYKTQNLEMRQYANSFAPNIPQMVYLIEGSLNEGSLKDDVVSITSETLVSLLTKLIFRDGFYVIFTTDLKDTIKWLNKIYDNLSAGGFEQLDEQQQWREYMTAKMRKTSIVINSNNNSDKNNWWLMSLSNIDGVSVKSAQSIIEKYPTIKHLISKYDECKNEDEKKKLVSDIVCNKRRLGNKVSENVYRSIILAEKESKKETKKKPLRKINDMNDMNECLIGDSDD